MEINALKRDVVAATAGQWVEDIPGMGDLRLKVRGENSPKVAALQARKLRAVPKNKRDRAGAPNFDEVMRITGEVLHEAVLLDWKGLTSNGESVAYEPELAREWLTNPDYQEFADAVAWASKVVANGDAERTEELAGN